MIKGILALFTSGVLTNPMVLAGIVLGSVFYSVYDGAEIFQIYKKTSFYGLAVVLSCIYVLGFRRVYTEDGETDWTETMLAIVAGVFRFVLASVLMISFISFFDMGDMKKIAESGI